MIIYFASRLGDFRDIALKLAGAKTRLITFYDFSEKVPDWFDFYLENGATKRCLDKEEQFIKEGHHH